MFYDPMICKLITHAQGGADDTADRLAAIDSLGRALDRYVIRGLNHNICFLRALCDHPRFRSGALSTTFIGDECV